jgi:hypothetical protein
MAWRLLYFAPGKGLPPGKALAFVAVNPISRREFLTPTVFL